MDTCQSKPSQFDVKPAYRVLSANNGHGRACPSYFRRFGSFSPSKERSTRAGSLFREPLQDASAKKFYHCRAALPVLRDNGPCGRNSRAARYPLSRHADLERRSDRSGSPAVHGARVRAGETGSVDAPLSAMVARHPWTQWPGQPAYGSDRHDARPAFAVAPRSGQHVRVPYRCARCYGSRRPRISVRLASDHRARTNRRHAGNPRPAVEHGRALSRRLLHKPDIGKGRCKATGGLAIRHGIGRSLSQRRPR